MRLTFGNVAMLAVIGKEVGLRIKELDRIYENSRGGDRKSNPNNSVLISQTDIANKLDISVDTLQNYKLLADMIPALSDLVDTRIITTAAPSILL